MNVSFFQTLNERDLAIGASCETGPIFGFAIRAEHGCPCASIGSAEIVSHHTREATLFWVRGAESKFGHEELGFVAIDRAQCDVSGTGVAPKEILDAEVIPLAGFGGEVGRRDLMAGGDDNSRLPFRAEMMFARINRNIEIRVGLGGTHPIAVHAPFDGGPGARFKDFVGRIAFKVPRLGCKADRREGEAATPIRPGEWKCQDFFVPQFKLREFDGERYGVAAAEAECCYAALQIAALQFVDQRDQGAGTGRADRMTERYGATVYVYFFGVELQHAGYGDRGHGESFVQLVEVHVLVAIPAGFPEQLFYSLHGSHHHPLGFDAADGLRDDARARLLAKTRGVFFAGDDHGRSAVVRSRGVPCGHRAVFLECGL